MKYVVSRMKMPHVRESATSLIGEQYIITFKFKTLRYHVRMEDSVVFHFVLFD